MRRRQRPKVLNGVTYRVMTGVGSLYITVNVDMDGMITEVFSTVGASGSEHRALVESLCRLISVGFQTCSTVDDTRDYMKDVIKQLRGIRGEGFHHNEGERIYSIPDAIAYVLREKVPATPGFELYMITGGKVNQE